MNVVSGIVPFEVPVDPDAPEARDWLIQELSKPEYQAAKPTLFDIVSKAISDWFMSLFSGNVGAPPPGLGIVIAIILVAAAIVVAFVIFGVPRLNRRTKVTGALFGDDDVRTSEQLRRAGESAAARGDFATAIAEMYRAVARGLAERTIVTTSPGTTARGFADRTAAVFPAHRAVLAEAATIFDEVRYLGAPGTAEQFGVVGDLERAIRTSRSPIVELLA